MMATLRLDTRGQACPVPTIMAVQAMRARPVEEVILVLTDDPVCAEDIPFQGGRYGYRARTESVAPSEWEITLSREPEGDESMGGAS